MRQLQISDWWAETLSTASGGQVLRASCRRRDLLNVYGPTEEHDVLGDVRDRW